MSALSPDEARARLAALLPELRRRHGVRSLALFGSAARGDSGAGSDVDVLVEFDQTPGLIGFYTLQQRLADHLGRRVDLATRPMIGPDLAPGVEAHLLPVWEDQRY